MKLYNMNLSPNCLRIRAVANELGVDLDIVDIDLRAGENRTEEFLALNPNAKVPVLVDGDFVLWESRAINTYLASRQPEHDLYPVDTKARAIVDQWSYWQAIHLGPAMQKVTFERFIKKLFDMGEPDEGAIAAGLKETQQFLEVLENNLAERDWITGKLSVADFAAASTFVLREKAAMSLDEVPNVKSWIEQMEARKSWQDAVAPIMAMLE